MLKFKFSIEKKKILNKNLVEIKIKYTVPGLIALKYLLEFHRLIDL